MTETPILQTKLYIPRPRTERVRRPRLLDRLNAGLDRKLTLVSAPPGSGKTTLLSEWAGGCGPDARVAWLSLDEDDNDAPRFWTYLLAALQRVEPALERESLSLLAGAQMPPARAFLVPLLNQLAALPGRVALVLDDYHVISGDAQASPGIHEGVAFLIDHLPPPPGGLHLVLSTRADPPLPLYRLRAQGQLNEFRSADLRFTPDETATLLNTVNSLGLPPADVAALESRTEGWIVGLQLAALSLREREDRHAFIAAFGGSHHYLLEYLTEEVVRRQPEPVRRFLVCTAVLDRLCGPLCEAVLSGSAAQQSRSEAAALLADLHARNLFVVPLDDERRWYRYHHLFADLLKNLLRQELPPAEISGLHLRASQWYEREGEAEPAIQHALAAHAFDRAADLIEGAAQALISVGRLKVLNRWFEALPEDTLRARPRLRLYQGWALNLSGRIEDAETILLETQDALAARPPSPENEGTRARLAALLTGIATLRQDTGSVIRQAQEALAYLPAEDRLSRARVLVALGAAHAYQDRLQEAIPAWQQAKRLALAGENPFLATAAIELLAGTLIYHQGRLRDGARELRVVLDLATTPAGTPEGKRLPFSGTAHALLAEVHLEWNDLDAAAGYLEAGVALLRQSGIGYGRIHTYCAQARLARARGDVQGVQLALRAAERALDAHTLWHQVLHLAACQVRLRLWMGDVEGAARWAACDPALTQREPPETIPPYLREVERISRAWVQLAQGHAGQALQTLCGLVAQAQAAGRLAQVIEACLIQALALQAQGEGAAALDALERALAWSEPEGSLRRYLEAGPDLIPLLRRVAARGAHTRTVSALLEAFTAGAPEGEAPASSVARPAPSPVEPLTPRELDVLRLICAGLSNREISERLTVTLNTVKKHTSNLYGKLGVRSRTQAIALAQALDLL